jgi:hypothetical protein
MSDERTENRLEALEDRIEALEAENQALKEAAETDDGTARATRRQALGLLGGVGLGGGLAAASRPAAAAPTSGQWEDTDGDDLLELPNHAGIDGVNDVKVVEPNGSIQAAIDKVADGGDGHSVVRLFPRTYYNEGSEIHLRPDVILDFNGAFLVLGSDHNGIFVDNGSQIRNATIKVNTNGKYTSSAVVLDTSRSEYGNYVVTRWRSGVYVDATIEGERKDGRGLELNDAASKGITLGVRFNLNIVACDTGVYADTGSGYINGIEARLTIMNPRIGLDIQGNGEFKSTLYGAIQPVNDTEIGIRNAAGNPEPTWHGEVWDGRKFTNNALVGEHITVIGQTCQSLKGDTDGSSRQMGISFRSGRMNMFDYENDNKWMMDNDADHFRISCVDGDGNTNRYLRIRQDGTVKIAREGRLRIPPEDIRYRKPRRGGEVAVASNAVTSSSGPELAVGGWGGNWNLMSGDKIYPE